MIEQRRFVLSICLLLVVSFLYASVDFDYNRRQSVDGVRKPEPEPEPFVDLLTTEELYKIKYGEGTAVIQQNDVRYLNFVRSQISRPPDDDTSRKLNRESAASFKNDYTDVVQKLLKNKTNGFYVECGAYNGVIQSNSLYLELALNWTGLLIEANAELVKAVMSLNRQAYVFGGCLSPVGQPTTMRFTNADGFGGVHMAMSRAVKDSIVAKRAFRSFNDVLCIPLVDLLSAIGVKHVDFLSLDVHGAEIPILKTVDFHQITIDLILVEVFDQDLNRRQKLFEKFIEFFKSTGVYREVWRGEQDLIVQRSR